MQVVQSYKFRLYPTKEQEAKFLSCSGCRRFVWNWALAKQNEHYKEKGKHFSKFDLNVLLTQLKKEHAFLCDVPLIVLRSALVSLDNAFKKFFAKQARYPRFKSRKVDPVRFGFQDNRVRLETGRVVLPKIGAVKARGRFVGGEVITASVKQDMAGRWFASCQVKTNVEPLPASAASVGIDLGLTTFAVLSNGEKVENPRFAKKATRQLARAQRTLSRRQKGSARRQKAKIRVAGIHQKVKSKREGFLHQLTTDLVRRFGTICIEDLNVKGLSRTKLAKSMHDAAHGELIRQLTYKALWYGRELVKVGRFYPSTKTCSNCGFVKTLTLKDRVWKCDLCSAVHDRDFNASVNILNEGLRIVAERCSETLNAHGARVSPSSLGGGC